jgi:hypothetical protein
MIFFKKKLRGGGRHPPPRWTRWTILKNISEKGTTMRNSRVKYEPTEDDKQKLSEIIQAIDLKVTRQPTPKEIFHHIVYLLLKCDYNVDKHEIWTEFDMNHKNKKCLHQDIQDFFLRFDLIVPRLYGVYKPTPKFYWLFRQLQKQDHKNYCFDKYYYDVYHPRKENIKMVE